MAAPADHEALEYGSVFASYRGHGTLRGKRGLGAPCDFLAFQLRDGNVVVLTNTSFENTWLFDVNVAETLHGTTTDGRSLLAQGLFDIGYLPPTTEPGIYAGYHCRELTIGQSGEAERATRFSRFAVTNVTLKTGRMAIAHPKAAGHVHVPPEYRERIKRLGVLRAIDVTAELIVPGPNPRESSEVATDVCSVLSLAYGTSVQWIARADHSESGTVLGYYRGSHVTKSYSPKALIDPRTEGDVERFLEIALPAYVKRKSVWDLTRCLLAFLDARAEEDFLEARGLKLVIVMEMVKNSFIAAEGWNEFVRPPGDFRDLRPKLKDAIARVFAECDWRKDERATAYENLSSLNRVPFRNHLLALCKRVGLLLSEGDIRLFVRCRNSLVHRGRFYCETVNEDDRRSCSPHRGPIEEYFWLLHVMDRLFLRLVDYRGPWIDWSEVGNPKRRDSF
jgi:hypothetical protein